MWIIVGAENVFLTEIAQGGGVGLGLASFQRRRSAGENLGGGAVGKLGTPQAPLTPACGIAIDPPVWSSINAVGIGLFFIGALQFPPDEVLEIIFESGDFVGVRKAYVFLGQI